MSLDIAPAILETINGEAAISGLLSEWQGNPAIFTRRPVPSDAAYPLIVINPDISISDDDGLTSDRPIVIRDVIIYGNTPNDYRTVEQIGYAIRELFHRERFSIMSADYSVIDVRVVGPFPGPTDDDQTIARVNSITFLLRKKP